MINSNIKAYSAANNTLDNFTQLIMLYDKAIACLHQAKEAINEKNIELRYNKLERAFFIITGLRDALDMDNGGEVAVTLKDWYTDTAARILSINTSNDVSMTDLCIKHLKEMKEAWIEAKKTSEESDSGSNDNVNNAKNFLPDMSFFTNASSKPVAISI